MGAAGIEPATDRAKSFTDSLNIPTVDTHPKQDGF